MAGPELFVMTGVDCTCIRVRCSSPCFEFFSKDEGQTVLHIAALNGDENMTRTLYLARANASLTDNEGIIHL